MNIRSVSFLICGIALLVSSCSQKEVSFYQALKENLKNRDVQTAWTNFDKLKSISPRFQVQDTTIQSLQDILGKLTRQKLDSIADKLRWGLELKSLDSLNKRLAIDSVKYYTLLHLMSENIPTDTMVSLDRQWDYISSDARERAPKQLKQKADMESILYGTWILKEKAAWKSDKIIFNKDGTFDEKLTQTLCPKCPPKQRSLVTVVTKGKFNFDPSYEIINRECISNIVNWEEKCGDKNYDKEFDGFCEVKKINGRWELGIFVPINDDLAELVRNSRENFEESGRIFVKAE